MLIHFLWTDPPAVAVAVRFAYVLWAPWGLALAAVLADRNAPSTA